MLSMKTHRSPVQHFEGVPVGDVVVQQVLLNGVQGKGVPFADHDQVDVAGGESNYLFRIFIILHK